VRTILVGDRLGDGEGITDATVTTGAGVNVGVVLVGGRPGDGEGTTGISVATDAGVGVTGMLVGGGLGDGARRTDGGVTIGIAGVGLLARSPT